MEEQCPKRKRTCSASSTTPQPPSPSNPEEERESVNESLDGSNSDSGSVTKPGSISVILSDPGVLDCPICLEPLTFPVVQCVNGHIACSPCCKTLMNKCPSCWKKIGHNRCRAIEKVIESVKVQCCNTSHGCRKLVSYYQKRDHEGNCLYAPCSCPFHGCIFQGSPESLSQHMSQEHSNSVLQFTYNFFFEVHVVPNDEFVVLQEEKDGVIFILIVKHLMSLKCMGTNPEQERFEYDLIVSSTSNSIKLESFTETIRELVDVPPGLDSLQGPSVYLSNTSEPPKLRLCIRSKDAYCF